MQRFDNLLRSSLQIKQMAGRELFNGKCRFDPEDVDRSMHTSAVDERERNGGQPIVLGRRPVEATNEPWITDTVAALTGFLQNPLQTLRLVCQAILGSSGFSEPLQELISFLTRTVGQVHATHRCEQPIDVVADPSRVNEEWRVRLA